MSEELKSTLKYLKNKNNTRRIKTITINEAHKVVEEIERLNKKIGQYENPEDMTLMFMWCDEKAKDEIKRLNNIIKEVREYVESYMPNYDFDKTNLIKLLEILDKENKC